MFKRSLLLGLMPALGLTLAVCPAASAQLSLPGGTLSLEAPLDCYEDGDTIGVTVVVELPCFAAGCTDPLKDLPIFGVETFIDFDTSLLEYTGFALTNGFGFQGLSLPPNPVDVNSSGELSMQTLLPVGNTNGLARPGPWDVVTLNFEVKAGASDCTSNSVDFFDPAGDDHKIYQLAGTSPVYFIPTSLLGLGVLPINSDSSFDFTSIGVQLDVACFDDINSYDLNGFSNGFPPAPTGTCISGAYLPFDANSNCVAVDISSTGCAGDPASWECTWSYKDICTTGTVTYTFVEESTGQPDVRDDGQLLCLSVVATLALCNEPIDCDENLPDPSTSGFADYVEGACGEDLGPDDVTFVSRQQFNVSGTWNNPDIPGFTPVSYCRYYKDTYTVTDPCSGQSKNLTAQYIITDTDPPALTCPDDVSVECLDDLASAAGFDFNSNFVNVSSTAFAAAGGMLSDDCVTSIGYQDAKTNGFDGCGTGEIIRTWTAEDSCGNVSTCEQILSVNDETIPSFTTANPTLTLDCSISPGVRASLIASFVNNVKADDNCSSTELTVGNGIVAVAGVTSNGPCDTSSTGYTWTATDDCSNSAVSLGQVLITDNNAPTATCPADTTVQCRDDLPMASTGTVTVSDLCCTTGLVVTLEDVATNGGAGCVGDPFIMERTYRATDSSGNMSECTQTLTVIDDMAPTIACPGPPGPTTDAFAGSADDSGVFSPGGDGSAGTWEYYPDADLYNTWFPNVFDLTKVKIVHLDFMVDITSTGAGSNGYIEVVLNWSTTDFVDTNGGVPFPDPTEENYIARSAVLYTLTGPTAGPVPVTLQYAIPFCPAWVSIDVRGVAVQQFAGTISHDCVDAIDCTDPILTLQAGDTPTNGFSTGDFTVDDNCSNGPLSITLAEDPSIAGDQCVAAVVDYIWRVTDACGNTADCLTKKAVVDDEPPTITCPDDVTVDCLSDVPAVDVTTVGTTDLCSTVGVTHVGDVGPADGCGSPSGDITRTYRATDTCGNFIECDQIITLLDTNGPENLTQPDDIVSAATSPSCTGATLTLPAATADDNCGTTGLSVFYSTNGCSSGPSGIGLPGDSYTFANGTTTVETCAVDACGNTTSNSFDVTVIDDVVVNAKVTLGGVNNIMTNVATFDRCITFEFVECGTPELQVDVLMEFISDGAGLAVASDSFSVPGCGNFTCARVRDRLNTLWEKVDPLAAPMINTTANQLEYDLDVQLASGNASGFLYPPEPGLDCIDVVDYIFVANNFNASVGADTACVPLPVFSHPDFNGDGLVDFDDLGFVLNGFGQCDDTPCCTVSPVLGDPVVRTEISVRELTEMGLGYLRRVDMDKDGWIDIDDANEHIQWRLENPRRNLVPANPVKRGEAVETVEIEGALAPTGNRVP